LDGATRQNKIEGILLGYLHIDREAQLQRLRRLFKKTGRDNIIENIAPEPHRRLRFGSEIEPRDLDKAIASGKKPHVVRGKPDRPIVAVNCFVSNPDLHLGFW
jgi:hypothetical protein